MTMPDPNTAGVVALSRIDSHEKVCSERYAEINKSFARVHGRVDWILYFTIAASVSAVGTLLMSLIKAG
jgi:predicted nucleic acid-binding Zn ribbon protein